jgi:hypothetical protein
MTTQWRKASKTEVLDLPPPHREATTISNGSEERETNVLYVIMVIIMIITQR